MVKKLFCRTLDGEPFTLTKIILSNIWMVQWFLRFFDHRTFRQSDVFLNLFLLSNMLPIMVEKSNEFSKKKSRSMFQIKNSKQMIDFSRFPSKKLKNHAEQRQ